MGLLKQLFRGFLKPSKKEELDLSEFILKGKLANIEIGKPIDTVFKLTQAFDYDGDIPATMELEFGGGIHFEISFLNNCILGITYDLTYENKHEAVLKSRQIKIALNGSTTFNDLHHYLTECSIGFTETVPLYYAKSIDIESSKTKLYFDDRNQLFKISVFDWDLYEKVSANL